MEDIENTHDIKGNGKEHAAVAFDCHIKDISHFNKTQDPFNPQNIVDGFMCRKDATTLGSLWITSVNGRALKKAYMVHATPKLAYPYDDFDKKQYKRFNDRRIVSYYISNKWDGSNILFFKYHDADGNVFISAKSRVVEFLKDGNFGPFCTLTKETMGLGEGDVLRLGELPEMLSELESEEVQSKCFELCGRKDPHLVKYDFDAELKPLFVSTFRGNIRPCVTPKGGYGPKPFNEEEVLNLCKKIQQHDLAKNEKFREENKIQLRYEYAHFITEGKILYLLDVNGNLLNRTMFKIKSPDVEHVHWANFDCTMQGRVREALEKIVLRGKQISEEALQSELDMGPKEWGKWCKDIMDYATQMEKDIPTKDNDKRRVIVLAGHAGSGRTEFSEELRKQGWIILGNGMLTSNPPINEFIAPFIVNLRSNCSLLVDLPNLNPPQRLVWLQEGKKLGILNIDCVIFDVSRSECEANLAKVGIKNIDANMKKNLSSTMSVPLIKEGFNKVVVLRSKEEYLEASHSYSIKS